MELVLSPGVLFLDEPITGLDSTMARSMMECLHRLSRKGLQLFFRFIKHRYSILKLFDTLLSIAAGRCIYHGLADNVLQFFSSVGFRCEEHDNPADFILDVLQGDRLSPSTDNENNQIECHFNEEYMKADIYKSIQNQISERLYVSSGNNNNNNNVRSEEKSRLIDIFYLSQ
ncbi:unnamed protein product [Rotaria magnacalcarata]|nr:unnamed protein product [Rotaria magnacalcarata]